jgi:hypothetical protein
MTGRTLLWTAPAVLYLAFCWWYTDLSGPLTSAEIERYASQLAEQGAAADRVAEMRQFMEGDTGRQFIMVNVIDMARVPRAVDATSPNDDAQALLDRYMQYMWPALLRRACHPVFVGDAVFDALDIVGIDGARHWSQAALMRYRSRRDVLEIATNPAFGGRHEFKMAALEKTIAFPVEPRLYLSDLRLLLGIACFAVVALADAILYRRSARRA